MTDRELLELAAKAAGVEAKWNDSWKTFEHFYNGSGWDWWNPLTDDGDALRLAVKLKIDVDFDFDRIDTSHRFVHAVEYLYDNPPTDPYAATRRAIVRAAAEIGRNMK